MKNLNQNVLLSDYIVDIVTSLVLAPKSSEGFQAWLEGDTEQPAYRPRKSLRKRAQRGGHIGGHHIPTEQEAALTLQSNWRGKRVRRVIRRQDICATAIQRIARCVIYIYIYIYTYIFIYINVYIYIYIYIYIYEYI
jgi:hypothetical protein